MEIIHLILGKANPERMNGVNKVVHEMATRQCESGENVEVWGITNHPVHDYPVRSFTTRLFQSERNIFWLSDVLKKEISAKQKGTIFHLHGGFIPQMYSASMWMKKNKIPFIITPHGSYNKIAMLKNKFLKQLYFHFFERKMLSAANSIHSLGQSEIDGLQSVFPNDKSVLIPYGLESLKELVQWKNTGEFIVGYCGRLDLYTKGLIELLQGFALFRQEQTGAKLWIIGDGKDQDKEKLIKVATAMNIQNSIVFFGSRYGEEKNILLLHINVLAVPSRNEGLPTVVLEAAAMGIPCLVTRATNTGDYINRYIAGIVIEHTDPNEIHYGLKRLYYAMQTEIGTQAIRANARRMIKEAFDWKLILGRFHKLYEA
ncbi:glycosyltransferase family 4 protein [Pedobacter cryoconitis]|uniref:glycosyltransferase family 4 protein n=1 Tax=Pedobacter cryoconitis TaxID=188932 RepID=UPI00161A1BF4|nr:glycosyltransferase [Pedobacter cryoconitis]MBB5647184.1 glycosyltransferase involved in cell wall biosynthesis [Pedobacter cryoconitis]